MITEPSFYFAAIPAVLIFGIAKGGFGGGIVIVAVPLMALVVSPITAAAILLPILCVMDLMALWVFRGRWIWRELTLLLPASILGILLGALLFEYMNAHLIRLTLGTISLLYTIQYWWHQIRQSAAPQKVLGPVAGITAGTAAGFTSFVAHAGAPPLSFYLLRRGMDRTSFVATATVFFWVVNYTKLIPYAWLGLLDTSNLITSLVLCPLAPIGIALGKWLHDRVSDSFFFNFFYITLFILGCKLTWDGIVGLQFV